MTLLNSRSRGRGRAGFTLIELLVVIAIIAVLVSLLGAGIFYAYVRMQDTGTQSDISQLASALETFKGKKGSYPPQRLRLCSNRAVYNSKPSAAKDGGAQFDQDSVSYISRIWPNLGVWTNLDWSGTGNLNIDEILEGDQVLVFFLGGIPWTTGAAGPTCNSGFASNGKLPTLQGGNVGRESPYFNFPSNRLLFRSNPATGVASAYFPSFLDYYGQAPYLYFSSHNRKNGYNPYPNSPNALGVNPNGHGFPIAVANYSGGGNAIVIPYYTVPYSVANPTLQQFQNAETFQILAAGRDGNFNTAPTNASTTFLWSLTNVGNLSLAGQDDFSNFSGSRLKVSQ